jgi:hypothetical protein
MYNINKSDKILKEEFKGFSDRELLEFQCLLQHKQNQLLNNQLNGQNKIENMVNFFYKLAIVQLLVVFITICFYFIFNS